MELGSFGVWTGGRTVAEADRPEVAQLAEQLGFGALWFGFSPRLTDMRPMLAATERLIIATGIVNVWHYEPEELAAEFAALDQEFPGRTLLGVGIAHPESVEQYARPLTKMSAFLDGLDRAAPPVPKERRCVAALGPKMLDLSAERSLGAHPYFTPVEHTRYARERLGPGPLVAPELACVVGEDPGRAAAREYARFYLRLKNYAPNLERFGFTGDEIAAASDRVVDAIVPQGSPERIASVVRAHLDAGADHVCLQAVGVQGVPREQWTALAQALLG